MNPANARTLTLLAPAKINLYLHITGRLSSGYHALDSLVAFSDIGDNIKIEPSEEFKFHVEGPFAKNFSAQELDPGPDSSNLVARAAWFMARAAQKPLNVRIALTKNLPLASGMGGGSSDAAAILRGLAEWWEIPPETPFLQELATRLGADVLACLFRKPARLLGIGEILDAAPRMNQIPVLLLNPGQACPTAKVFSGFQGPFRNQIPLPPSLEQFSDLVEFLKEKTGNDLCAPAMEIAPEIRAALDDLESQKGCALARMSGSGATCFGLFENESYSQQAAKIMAVKNPGWWVRAGCVNKPDDC